MKRCQGCTQDRNSTSPYECLFRGEDDWMTVWYCNDCAELAMANWTGDTLGIRSPTLTKGPLT